MLAYAIIILSQILKWSVLAIFLFAIITLFLS
jgi:hypothetical protein